FYDENLIFHRTEFLKVVAPNVKITSSQKVSGLIVNPTATVKLNPDIDGLKVNLEKTFFELIPPNSKGDWEHIRVEPWELNSNMD
ncbi:hypothetical protein, partial [Helicobacter pylori]|uniref:hypothetical protein n=1 Tax=Helicobacter pylori TaxID=210 RepID=UPI0029298E63